MTTVQSNEATGLECTLRAMAQAEAQALDGAAFMARLQQAMARDIVHGEETGAAAAPATQPTAPAQPAEASNASLPWLALPLGLALALTVWLALGFLDTSATQWSAAISPMSDGKAPGTVTATAWMEALLSQVAGLVLCAWCAWTTWQLRR